MTPRAWGCLSVPVPRHREPPGAATATPGCFPQLCCSSCCCPQLEILCPALAHHPGGSEERLGSGCSLPRQGLACRSCGTGEFFTLEELGWPRGTPQPHFCCFFGVKKVLSCSRQPQPCPEGLMAAQSPAVLPRASRDLL